LSTTLGELVDVQLLLALILGVGLLIGLILFTRFDAFLALVTASIATGLIAGVSPTDTVQMIITGFGNTLGSIGIVIVLGVMIGKLLEISGAADTLAAMFLAIAGKGREDWAMAGTGALVSIPVFCDSGFVIMHPIPRSLTRMTHRSFVGMSLALGAGMTTTHHLVPPTPGPLAVAGLLEVDLGQVILFGGLMALSLIPVVVTYARYMGPKLEDQITPEVRAQIDELATVGATGGMTTLDADLADDGTSAGGSGDVPASRRTEGTGTAAADEPRGAGRRPRGREQASDMIHRPEKRPGRLISSLPLVIPILLILSNTVSVAMSDEGEAPTMIGFLGNPIVAILIGLIIALYTLVPRETPKNKVSGWLTNSIAAAGIILAITGAGGALGNVLRESGVGDAMAEAIGDMALPAFLVPFLIATLVRLAQGSGTVAMITAGSLTAPLLAGGLDLNPVVGVLAATAGSMFFSYYNDSYFWVVTKFTGLDGTAALRGWSGITTALWLVAGVELAILSLFL
jgi:gluconate:H+ symporter, GntP family